MIPSVLFSAREKRKPQAIEGPYVTIQPQWVTQMMTAAAANKLEMDSLHINESLQPTIEKEDAEETHKSVKTAAVSEEKEPSNEFTKAAELDQKIKRAGDKLKTPQEQKVWAALQDLVFVQNFSTIRQLDVHNHLRQQHGKSVDSKLILPLIGNFEKITGRKLKAAY